jgi:hypothetical protein
MFLIINLKRLAMLKIIFYIKTDNVKLNGGCLIFAKISIGTNTTTISTGKSTLSERWTTTNHLRNVLKLQKEKVTKEALDMLIFKS